jgi:hypothetical protein
MEGRTETFEVKPRRVGALFSLLARALRNEELVVQTDKVDRTDLPQVPIPPDWVIAGKPQARVKRLTAAADGGLDSVLWDSTAGTFYWYFATDEFVHILEGEVAVSDEDGQGTRVLRVGDVAYFPAGKRCIWHVENYVRKLALRRDNEVGLLFRARRKLGKLLGSKS